MCAGVNLFMSARCNINFYSLSLKKNDFVANNRGKNCSRPENEPEHTQSVKIAFIQCYTVQNSKTSGINLFYVCLKSAGYEDLKNI